ncbi:MAG: hypothetical protein H7242_05610 [Microbacteriaceae bacterium]|nr:hypothetical protein [Burkholderiaceae bacterium]
MKLQHSLIAGACLAVCSLSSFAATIACPAANPADSATAVTWVNSCAPAQTLFIGGASTLKGNALAILNAKVFDTSKMVPITIKDKGSVSGIAGNVVAAYGKNTAGDNIFVVYNYNNGSAAGVSQLFAKPADVAEADVVFVGPSKKVDHLEPGTAFVGTCVASASAGAGTLVSPFSIDCTTHIAQQADIAISDVRAQELYAVYAAATKGKAKDLTQTALFSQSFGVAVSPLLYSALQTKNGLTAGDLTAANQPSITRAEYASLVSKAGSIKSLAALTGNAGLTDPLTLARRDDLSGTQASSNIFFANGQCGGNGNVLVAKSLDEKVGKAGGLLGGLAIVSIADAATYPSLHILNAAVSNDVKKAVSSETDYAIGVLNVGGGGTQVASPAVGAGVGRFIKIDGVSPNFSAAGAAGSLNQLRNGSYPFAVTSYALVNTKLNAKVPAKKVLTDALISGFKDSTVVGIPSGIAYFDGSAAKGATAARAGGNNCSPIVTGSVASFSPL